MAVQIRYLGWTAFELITERETRVLLDPMLIGRPQDGVPPGPVTPEELERVDLVLVTHAAADHVGQAFTIMQRFPQARLVCDVATRYRAMEEAGIPDERIYRMVSGVQFAFDEVTVKALAAQHLSLARMPTGFISAQPLSYLLTIDSGERIFFGGDTSLHGDLRLYGELYQPHVAILGVGGVDVHGQSLTELHPAEAALVAKWLGVRIAIPMHYRFREGEEFLVALQQEAPEVKGLLLQPGESFTFLL